MSDYKVHAFKILLMGDASVGKSTLTIQFVSNKFIEEYDPTVESSYRKTLNVDNKICVLDIIDTAGRDEYENMLDSYIRQARGYILMFSITSRESFDKLEKYLTKIIRVQDSSLEEVAVVIVGNKCDLEEMRKVSTEEAEAYAESKQLAYVETSAKERINVDECFYGITKLIKDQQDSATKTKAHTKKNNCYIL